MKIAIVVNGKSMEANDGNVVTDILHQAGIESEALGVAVAVNRQVVPKREWASRRIRGGDEIEIIRAVQGG